MKPFLFKQIIPAFVLVSFLTMVFFGLGSMAHGSDGRMQGDCPFSAMQASLCPQGSETAALHHISEYQSFLNVPVGYDLTTVIIVALLALAAALVFSALPLLVQQPLVVTYFYDPPPASLSTRKITSWLSLFENSPSFV